MLINLCCLVENVMKRVENVMKLGIQRRESRNENRKKMTCVAPPLVYCALLRVLGLFTIPVHQLCKSLLCKTSGQPLGKSYRPIGQPLGIVFIIPGGTAVADTCSLGLQARGDPMGSGCNPRANRPTTPHRGRKAEVVWYSRLDLT